MRKKVPELLPAEHQQIFVLDSALRYARAHLGADITAQRLLILINVFLHEGVSQSELLDKLASTSITALSRNLADLSKRTSRKAAGPGLVEYRVDTENLRKKHIHLTGKGRRFLIRLMQNMAAASATSR